MQLINYIRNKFPFFVALSLTFLLASCGSYQYVGYDNDGIYSDEEVVVYEEARTVPVQDNSSYYKDYFTEKSLQYSNIPDDGSAIFTDIDSYVGNYEDDIYEEDIETGYAGWGQNSDQVNINIYSNWGWNNYWGWNNWGWYRPWRWNSWGYGNWGWNNWGYYNNWNSWYYVIGYAPLYGVGFYNPYYYSNPYYWRGYSYVNGRRSLYANGGLGRQSHSQYASRRSSINNRSSTRSIRPATRSTRTRLNTRSNSRIRPATRSNTRIRPATRSNTRVRPATRSNNTRIRPSSRSNSSRTRVSTPRSSSRGSSTVRSGGSSRSSSGSSRSSRGSSGRRGNL